MKKLLITITIIAILGILAAVGFFGYNKYQEVELEKNKLQSQQKENDDSDSQSSNETVNNNQEQAATKEEQQQVKVNRNNVFDYLFAGLEQSNADGFDKSKVNFQEPTQDENGNWKIMGNNKSGHGSYVFEVTTDGLVQKLNNAGRIEDSVQVNLD